MVKLPKFNFLPDQPTQSEEQGYFNFYHNYLAPALKEILSIDSTPRTIGLYGSWGTGKSTLIKMIENMLKQDEKLDIPVFIFDAWKYQNDSLRRTFLYKFDAFLRDELEIELPEDILLDLDTEVSNSTQSQEKVKDERSLFRRVSDYLFVKNVTLSWTLLFASIFLIVNLLFGQHPIVKQIQGLWGFLATITVLSVAAPEFVKSLVAKIVKDITSHNKDSFNQVTRIESKRALNSPEQFETKFRDLLGYISHKKFIIVFDNIDRVPGDLAISMLSTIKSFMEPDVESEIISIIPCDPDAINQRIKTFYYQHGEEDQNGFVADEYLRKIFSLILWLPSYLPNDLEEYTRSKIAMTGEVQQYTNDYDVILVINAAFKKNPRDIIQFINNFTALVITVLQTDISSQLLENIGYLAKVQVIRQKFPKEFKLLQNNWNNPESVEGGSEDFKQFMVATNRITSNDAEPYIFLKDPLDSRGIKNYSDIALALQDGSAEDFEKLILGLDREKLTYFTTDLLKKYRSIPSRLVNIYNTQFHVMYDDVPDNLKTNYYDLLASLVDTDLWPEYKLLSVPNTFKLISNAKVRRMLKRAIVERFVQAIESKEEKPTINIELAKNIIEQYTLYPKLFTNGQRSLLTGLLENYADFNKHTIERYTANKGIESVMSREALNQYISSSRSLDLASTVDVVNGYRNLYSEKFDASGLIGGISNKFNEQQSEQPGYSDYTETFVKSLSAFVSKFKPVLKSVSESPEFDSIANHLINSIGGAGTFTQKAHIMIALWWITSYLNASPKQSAKSQIESFIQSSDQLGISVFLDYWSANHQVSLVTNTFKSSFDVAAVNNPEIANYIHRILSENDIDKADDFLVSIISQRGINPEQEVDFVLKSGDVGNKSKILSHIITRALSNNYYNEGYLPIFNTFVPRNGNQQSKQEITDYLKNGVTLDDETVITTIERLFSELAALNKQSKVDIMQSLLTASKNDTPPYEGYTFARLAFLANKYSDLDQQSQSELIGLIKAGFSTESAPEFSSRLFTILGTLPEISYGKYPSVFTDTYTEVSNWPTDVYRIEALKSLRQFKKGRLVAGEKAFWKSIDEKIPQD